MQIAEERDLDLVEISPDANPPVAKIVDWGKYNYQRTKQMQKNKRNAKALEVKQMRFGLKISEHDLGVKLKKVVGLRLLSSTAAVNSLTKNLASSLQKRLSMISATPLSWTRHPSSPEDSLIS